MSSCSYRRLWPSLVVMLQPRWSVVLLTAVWTCEGLVVPKCCDLGEIMVKRTCVPGNWTGPRLRFLDSELEVMSTNYSLEKHPVDCVKQRRLHRYEFWILEDGYLYRGPQYPNLTEYCVDYIADIGRVSPLYCLYKNRTTTESKTGFVLNSIGAFLSIPAALATIIIYLFLKELNNLHGKITICVLVPFIFGSISIVLTGLEIIHVITHPLTCIIAGYAIQFFFMATFFWLNVMCFDIYWAFSGLKNLTGSVTERERKKLILYSFYAWGFPLLILLVTVGIDFSPYVPANSIFKPKVGVDKCFFKETVATGIYFYMPMGLIIVNNIFLFSVTAYRICTLRRETAVLKRGDSRKHDSTNDKERFSLYLKLFLVMGINWVMELVSFLAGGPEIIWYIPDFTNTLQGVFIFIIFVWKKRVRRLVWAKLTNCCGKKTMSESTKSPWTASTRNTSSHTTTSGVSHNSIKMTPVTTATNGDVSQAAVA